jgi:Zn finger protein HypA/HybF involved in hydrogenase expression
LAVERVREAGGPLDEASYTCHCGYLFSAAVSATVVCPHCGSDQAW